MAVNCLHLQPLRRLAVLGLACLALSASAASALAATPFELSDPAMPPLVSENQDFLVQRAEVTPVDTAGGDLKQESRWEALRLPLFAGGAVLALIAIFTVSGLRRGSRWRLATLVVAVAIVGGGGHAQRDQGKSARPGKLQEEGRQLPPRHAAIQPAEHRA